MKSEHSSAKSFKPAFHTGLINPLALRHRFAISTVAMILVPLSITFVILWNRSQNAQKIAAQLEDPAPTPTAMRSALNREFTGLTESLESLNREWEALAGRVPS